MRRLLFALAAFTLLATACQQVHVPRSVVLETPESAQKNQEQLQPYLPPFKNLTAKLDTLSRVRWQMGKLRAVVYVLHALPDKVSLRIDREPAGALLRITQKGDQVALLDVKNGAFYTGTREDLTAIPGIVGIEPLVLARILLANQQAAKILAENPNFTPWPEPTWWNRSEWVETTGPNGLTERYKIRLEDGLVESMEWRNKEGEVLIRAFYEKYGIFKDRLCPEKIRLSQPGQNLRITAQLENVKWDREESPSWFPITAPPQFETYPLKNLVERMEESR